MTIYIEYLLIDNFVIDYVIIMVMEFILKKKFNKFRVIIVSLIGAISAIFLPIINSKILLFLYKVLFSLLMVVMLKKYDKFKQYCVHIILFYFSTFLMGGIMIGLMNLLGIEYRMTNVAMYQLDVPIGIVVILLLLTLALVKIICKVVVSKFKLSKSLYDVTIFCNNERMKIMGYLDTGNHLTYDGGGVIVISISTFLKLKSGLIMCGIEGLSNIKYIDVGGIGNSEKFMSFVVDKIIVADKEFGDVRIAVATKNFDNFDCILHSQYV